MSAVLGTKPEAIEPVRTQPTVYIVGGGALLAIVLGFLGFVVGKMR